MINLTKKIIIPLILIVTGFWFYQNSKKTSEVRELVAGTETVNSEKIIKKESIITKKNVKNEASPDIKKLDIIDTPVEDNISLGAEEYKVELQRNIENLKIAEEKCKKAWDDLEQTGPLARSGNWAENADDIREVLNVLQTGDCFHPEGKKISDFIEKNEINDENFAQLKDSLSAMDMGLKMSNSFKKLGVMKKVISGIKETQDPELKETLNKIMLSEVSNSSNLYENLIVSENIKEMEKAGLLPGAKEEDIKKLEKIMEDERLGLEEFFKKNLKIDENPEEMGQEMFKDLKEKENQTIKKITRFQRELLNKKR